MTEPQQPLSPPADVLWLVTPDAVDRFAEALIKSGPHDMRKRIEGVLEDFARHVLAALRGSSGLTDGEIREKRCELARRVGTNCEQDAMDLARWAEQRGYQRALAQQPRASDTVVAARGIIKAWHDEECSAGPVFWEKLDALTHALAMVGPSPASAARRVVQHSLTATEGGIFHGALCDDGTVWEYHGGAGWQALPPIPQGTGQ